MMSNLTLILTQGGPQGSTETMISYMYKQTTEMPTTTMLMRRRWLHLSLPWLQLS